MRSVLTALRAEVVLAKEVRAGTAAAAAGGDLAGLREERDRRRGSYRHGGHGGAVTVQSILLAGRPARRPEPATLRLPGGVQEAVLVVAAAQCCARGADLQTAMLVLSALARRPPLSLVGKQRGDRRYAVYE